MLASVINIKFTIYDLVFCGQDSWLIFISAVLRSGKKTQISEWCLRPHRAVLSNR